MRVSECVSVRVCACVSHDNNYDLIYITHTHTHTHTHTGTHTHTETGYRVTEGIHGMLRGRDVWRYVGDHHRPAVPDETDTHMYIYIYLISVSHAGKGGGAGVGVGRRCMLVHKRLYTATGIVCLYVFMCDNVL